MPHTRLVHLVINAWLKRPIIYGWTTMVHDMFVDPARFLHIRHAVDVQSAYDALSG